MIIDITTKACKGTRNYVRYLEHMHINVSLAHSSRGAVSIYLVSPMGTRSRVLGRRKVDTKRGSFKNWAFLSIHFWGENPHGKWRLEIESKSVFSKDNFILIEVLPLHVTGASRIYAFCHIIFHSEDS